MLIQNNFYTIFRYVFDLNESVPLTIAVVASYYDTLACEEYDDRKFPKKLDANFFEWI